jgi:hypothetical protein
MILRTISAASPSTAAQCHADLSSCRSTAD